MKKSTTKTIACTAAAVLSLTMCSVLPAGAASVSYVLGDVDMDGVITGHDAAMVSRYVQMGDVSLSEEELALADVNQDGTVDQADADQIYAEKKYALGSMMKQADHPDGNGVRTALCICALQGAGYQIQFTDELPAELPEMETYSCMQGELSYYTKDGSWVSVEPGTELYDTMYDLIWNGWFERQELTMVEYHLADANADGKVDLNDTYQLLYAYAMMGAGYDLEETVYADGKYYLGGTAPKQFTDNVDLMIKRFMFVHSPLSTCTI